MSVLYIGHKKGPKVRYIVLPRFHGQCLICIQAKYCPISHILLLLSLWFHDRAQECAIERFCNDTTCPICKYQFTHQEEIHQIRLYQPRPHDFDYRKRGLELLFAQESKEATDVNIKGLFLQLRRQGEKLKAGTRFVLKQALRENGHLSNNLERARQLLEKTSGVASDLKKTNLQLEASRDEAVRLLESAQKDVQEKDIQLMQFRKVHASMAPQSPHGSSVGRATGSIDGGSSNVGSTARRVSDISAGMPDNGAPRGSHLYRSRDSTFDRPPLSSHGGPPPSAPNYSQQTYAPGRHVSQLDGGRYTQEALHRRAVSSSNGSRTINQSTNSYPHPRPQQHPQRPPSQEKQAEQQHRMPRETHPFPTSNRSHKNTADKTDQWHRQPYQQSINRPQHQRHQSNEQPPSQFSSSQNHYEQPMPTARSVLSPTIHPHERPQMAGRQQNGAGSSSVASMCSHNSGKGTIRDFNVDHDYSFLKGTANGRRQHGCRETQPSPGIYTS